MAQGLFDTNLVELDAARMVSTFDGNYAILSPALPSGWRA